MGKTLKILAFSDLHCDAAAAAAIVRDAQSADWVIGAGDFATMRRGIERTIDVLRAIDRPTIVVPGNGESYEELQEACRGWNSAHVLHGDGTTIDGLPVFGVGGAIPITPFGTWSYDFSEEQAAEWLAEAPAGSILVSHSPPHGACDRNSAGDHLGSRSLRRFIEQRSPRLVICGHIHDSWRQRETIGATIVLNAGPQGEWVELQLD